MRYTKGKQTHKAQRQTFICISPFSIHLQPCPLAHILGRCGVSVRVRSLGPAPKYSASTIQGSVSSAQLLVWPPWALYVWEKAKIPNTQNKHSSIQHKYLRSWTTFIHVGQSVVVDKVQRTLWQQCVLHSLPHLPASYQKTWMLMSASLCSPNLDPHLLFFMFLFFFLPRLCWPLPHSL